MTRRPSTTPPTAGLQAIAATSKNFGDISKTVVQQQRTNERLAIASSPAPWCNSTTRGEYRAPELSAGNHRAGALDAFKLPSRTFYGQTYLRGK